MCIRDRNYTICNRKYWDVKFVFSGGLRDLEITNVTYFPDARYILIGTLHVPDKWNLRLLYLVTFCCHNIIGFCQLMLFFISLRSTIWIIIIIYFSLLTCSGRSCYTWNFLDRNIVSICKWASNDSAFYDHFQPSFHLRYVHSSEY